MRAPKPVDPRRSALMRAVRRTGTTPETIVSLALRELGAAYRRDVRSLPGSPDFANKKRRWAIFVNGCFWHHHKNCRRATIPKTNSAFWRAKFIDNRVRDARTVWALRRRGYRVVVIWECDVAEAGERLLKRISKVLETRRVDVAETVDH
ncbi:MAG: very short patch repair endonuclease [Microvirga sp.]|nr:very short patch repair endonuclease [Microvirga sp.]